MCVSVKTMLQSWRWCSLGSQPLVFLIMTAFSNKTTTPPPPKKAGNDHKSWNDFSGLCREHAGDVLFQMKCGFGLRHGGHGVCLFSASFHK